ncbi:hypothetical protein FOZ63_025557 [Perkinsus olseni]|uniref:Cysteine protease n=1 Tax=Perkinsus olseni TaxID=32597 RepID=A0A7J6R8R6_PEROL|nr:hypothetical protein FOZ63_025557 [Perkinsus olseni]
MLYNLLLSISALLAYGKTGDGGGCGGGSFVARSDNRGNVRGSAELDDSAAADALFDFQRTFNKTYHDEAEAAAKAAVFEDNWKRIMQHNAEDHTFKLEVNEYTDMTDDEWANHMLVRGGLELPAESPLEAEVDELRADAQLPLAVDWLRAGVLSPVKNQGHCGGCWAFSTTGALEARYHLLRKRPISLSEQELIDCGYITGNHGCDGGLMGRGFEFVGRFGLDLEARYPYTAEEDYCYLERPRIFSGTYIEKVTRVPRGSEYHLMKALTTGPVSVAVKASSFHFKHYRSGVLTGSCGGRVDHGVLAVGYGVENGVEYWLVKNSWGARWGDRGYIKLARNVATGDGLGQCGILSYGVYPTLH